MWISPGTCGRGFLSVCTCGRGTFGTNLWPLLSFRMDLCRGILFRMGLSSFVRDTLHEIRDTRPKAGSVFFCWRVNLYSRAKRILVYWPAAVGVDCLSSPALSAFGEFSITGSDFTKIFIVALPSTSINLFGKCKGSTSAI